MRELKVQAIVDDESKDDATIIFSDEDNKVFLKEAKRIAKVLDMEVNDVVWFLTSDALIRGIRRDFPFNETEEGVVEGPILEFRALASRKNVVLPDFVAVVNNQ